MIITRILLSIHQSMRGKIKELLVLTLVMWMAVFGFAETWEPIGNTISVIDGNSYKIKADGTGNWTFDTVPKYAYNKYDPAIDDHPRGSFIPESGTSNTLKYYGSTITERSSGVRILHPARAYMVFAFDAPAENHISGVVLGMKWYSNNPGVSQPMMCQVLMSTNAPTCADDINFWPLVYTFNESETVTKSVGGHFVAPGDLYASTLYIAIRGYQGNNLQSTIQDWRFDYLTATFEIEAGYAPGNHVFVDNDGVLVINGMRKFMFGGIRSLTDNWQDPDSYVAASMKLAHDYRFAHKSPDIPTWISDANTYLDIMENVNVGVELEIPRVTVQNERLNNIGTIVDAVKAKSALRMWKLYDEPRESDGLTNEILKSCYNRIKEHDPCHPVEIVDHNDFYQSVDACDIWTCDQYPMWVSGSFPDYILNWPEGLKRAANTMIQAKEYFDGKGFHPAMWIMMRVDDRRFKEAYDDGKNPDELDIDSTNYRPTRMELRGQAYAAIAAGAGGLSCYWDKNSESRCFTNVPAGWNRLIDLGEELNAYSLRRALVSTEPVPQGFGYATWNNIYVWERALNGEVYVGIVYPTVSGYANNVEITAPFDNYWKVRRLPDMTCLMSKSSGEWYINESAFESGPYGIDKYESFNGNTLVLRMDPADTLVLRFEP